MVEAEEVLNGVGQSHAELVKEGNAKAQLEPNPPSRFGGCGTVSGSFAGSMWHFWAFLKQFASSLLPD